MKYVDGFVIPVKKKDIKAYLKVARFCKRIYLKAGALDYTEGVGEDLMTPCGLVFPKLARLKKGETVVFAYIVYKTKAHRNRINKIAMKEVERAFDLDNMPFDVQRISWGVVLKFWFDCFFIGGTQL